MPPWLHGGFPKCCMGTCTVGRRYFNKADSPLDHVVFHPICSHPCLPGILPWWLCRRQGWNQQHGRWLKFIERLFKRTNPIPQIQRHQSIPTTSLHSLLGIGNILMGDEGVGSARHRAGETFDVPEWMDILDGGVPEVFTCSNISKNTGMWSWSMLPWMIKPQVAGEKITPGMQPTSHEPWVPTILGWDLTRKAPWQSLRVACRKSRYTWSMV